MRGFRNHTIKAFMILGYCLVQSVIVGQPRSFQQLDVLNGLSDNSIRSLAIDKKGFLWIGTMNGLNVYDGYGLTSYSKEFYPAIPSDEIFAIGSDREGRIWIGTMSGVAMIDASRKFHRITLRDSIEEFSCHMIQETDILGTILFTEYGQFYYDSTKTKWEVIDWLAPAFTRRIRDAERFDQNKLLVTTDSAVLIIDYTLKKVSFNYPVLRATSSCRFDMNHVAFALTPGIVNILDVQTGRIVNQYKLDGYTNNIPLNITQVRRAANGHLIITTSRNGLFILDLHGNLAHYNHDPVDNRSISSNNLTELVTGSKGEVVIGSGSAGISIFNVRSREAGMARIFKDDKGNFFDGYINSIAEDKKGFIWIGAEDRLIRWDKKKNISTFYFYSHDTKEAGRQNQDIRVICFDNYGRLWVNGNRTGLALFDESSGKFRLLKKDSSMGPGIINNVVLDMFVASDGKMWIATPMGPYRVNISDLSMIGFKEHRVLKVLSTQRINKIIEDRAGKIWFGTYDQGLYCYDAMKNSLKNISERDGLIAPECIGLMEDQRGRIYIGTSKGFSFINPDGKISSFGKKQGLKYERCEGFLEDNAGFIWVSNNKCLVRFDPRNDSLAVFDENAGISPYGFRVNASLKTSNGELLWGTQGGINYFYTGQPLNIASLLSVNIYQAAVKDSVIGITGNEKLLLTFANNSILIRFSAINLKGSRNIIYQYQLEGYDDTWQSGTDIREARYSALPPGEYSFNLKASVDGINWIPSINKIYLTVVPPFWYRWWFITAFALLLGLSTYLVIHYRNKKIRERKEELEIEQAINYFASSIYEQQTVEAIVWDVARNCIGRLNFEDCVIYLIDEKEPVLRQVAAHGPKNPRLFEIEKPIEIPIGKGIVGSVAKTGKAEIINDTSKDPRYIVDDEPRNAEISVPILSNDRVLGVIDCEHSKKGFFTQKHLSILTTIASLCANKIIRARAEEEKEHAQLVLMDTQRKMTEVEMQALRAQMNPHFIFNCLNSINRYIVKSDHVTASLYLTKFAKLIRLILDNSYSKNVTLANELEALKLYIEMESLRFDKKFQYKVLVSEEVKTDSIELPPLIIQPYVENAIWHGLLHKERPGSLQILLSMVDEGLLQCIIEDDGIGRQKAQELKSKSATKRKSLGMKLTEDRLALMNRYGQINTSVEILDLCNADGEAAGTRVILKIPV